MSSGVQLWKTPSPEDVEFVLVNGLIAPLPRQVSSFCKLVYFEHGAKRFRYRRGGYAAASGDLLLIPPGESHEADAPEEVSAVLRILHLPESVLEPLFPENRMRPKLTDCLSLPFIADPIVILYFRQLHQRPNAFASELEQQTRLLQLLDALHKVRIGQDSALTAPRQEPQSIRRLKHYIEAHYAEEITLAQLAQITGLNAAYLCRAFTQAVGMPPHAYQIAVRIDRARVLLRQENTVGQVAQQTGFYDQSHFIRHFRRLVQMSPSQYAKQVKNVQDIIRQ